MKFIEEAISCAGCLEKPQVISGYIGPCTWFSVHCRQCGCHDEFLSYGEALEDWNQRQLKAWTARDALL